MSFAGLTLTIDPALASPGDEGTYIVHAKRFEARYFNTYFQTDLVTCTLIVDPSSNQDVPAPADEE